MDLFNTKKISDLELENSLLQKKVSTLENNIKDLEYKINCYDIALKAFNKYITNEVLNVTDYLKTQGRQKSVNGQKVSCFELFLKDRKNV